MQTTINDSNLVMSPGLQPKNFSIAASAHAFQILSSSLYSNKIAAVIRELSCNAYDAHQFLKKGEVPFEVHLPTYLDPTFSVRDFGPGLSEEEIYSLYTTYFASGHSKIESNDYIGCFGLGSKSFFAYTDSATITSYHGGYATSYSLVIENGFPKVIKLPLCTPTNETGLSVAFSVKSGDISTFTTTAREIYDRFTTPPIVNGEQFKPTPSAYIYKGKNFCLQPTKSCDVIIMGNIAYKLSTHRGLEIEAQVGDCDITPSRESLSYTTKTKEWLKQKMSEVVAEAESYIKEQEDNCKSKWDQRLFLQTLTSYSDNIWTRLHALLPAQRPRPPIIIVLSRDKYDIMHVSAHCRPKKVDHIACNASVRFILNDIKRGGISRARTYAKETKNDIYVCTFKNKEDKQFFCNEVGIIDEHWILASSLTPKKVERSITPTTNMERILYKFNYRSYNTKLCWTSVKRTSENLKQESGYYILLNERYLPVNFLTRQMDTYELDEMLIRLDKLNISARPHVYGVRQKTASFLKECGWKEFSAFYEDTLQTHYLQHKKKLEQYASLLPSTWSTISHFTDTHRKKISIKSPLHLLCDLYDEFKANKIFSLYDILQDKVSVSPQDEALFDIHPLLKWGDDDTGFFDKIIPYLNLDLESYSGDGIIL